MPAITSENVFDIIRRVNRRAYVVNPFHLIQYATYEETATGEILVFYDTNSLLFPCHTLSNLAKKTIRCYQYELDSLRIAGLEIKHSTLLAHEYFYRTQDFVTLSGKLFKKMRQRLRYFNQHYNYQLHDSFDPIAVHDFIDRWGSVTALKKQGENLETMLADQKSAHTTLKLFPHISTAKSLYVSVNQELIGFAIWNLVYEDFWVGYIQKTDHSYQGLTELINHERAKSMPVQSTFSLGDDAADPGLATHKRELQPCRIEPLLTIETGNFLK